MKIINIPSDYINTRLDRFVRKEISNLAQADIEIALRKGLIRVNNKKQKSNYRLQDGDIIGFFENIRSVETKTNNTITYNKNIIQKIKEAILFQDENILAINKFPGIAVQGGSKVVHSLDRYLPIIFPSYLPKLVHRIDKDTSGVLLFALNNKAAAELSAIIRNRQIKKKYWCVVVGDVKKQSDLIITKLTNEYKVSSGENGKEAISDYQVIARTPNASLLEMSLITGRKHQLRVNCLELGYPILGDGKYGGKNAFIKGLANKLHLHARSIEIDSFCGKKLHFVAPLPLHMVETFNFLGFNQLIK